MTTFFQTFRSARFVVEFRHKSRHTFRVLRMTLSLVGLFFFASSGQANPQRVVSLAPNLTEIVISLGGADQLCTVTPFCVAPDNVQRLPGGIQPEAETVLALEPDLVLATSMTPATTRRQLQNLGLSVEVIDTPSLDAIRHASNHLADLLHLPQPATNSVAKKPPTRSVALLFGADTGYSAGCGTHAHEILEGAGLRNIAARTSGPWPQLSEEFLLAEDPELIIVADYGSSSSEEIRQTLRRHPVRRHLSAVQSGRILVFPAVAFSIPGPAALNATAELQSRLSDL